MTLEEIQKETNKRRRKKKNGKNKSPFGQAFSFAKDQAESDYSYFRTLRKKEKL